MMNVFAQLPGGMPNILNMFGGKKKSGAGAPAANAPAIHGDLEKTWHGLHFVFTGVADEAAAPFGYLLSGGEEVGDDLGYGPARYLTPAEVREFRDALNTISDQEFDRRFDLAAMERFDIYPGIWDEDRVDLLEEYTDCFVMLKDDLDAIVKAGDGMLIGIA
jgi:hypothetical protein